MATSLSYQTASEYIASPLYRKASSIPEYFDTDNDEEIKHDPFETINNQDDQEEEVDEFEDNDSDPFSEVDEFLDNDSDPFTTSDEDPFQIRDVDPFLVDEKDPFDEVDEFNMDEVDPFLVEDVDVFNANSLLDGGGVVTDPFLAEQGCQSLEELDGEDVFLIEEEEQGIILGDGGMHGSLGCIQMMFTLQNLGLLCLLLAMSVLLVNCGQT